MSLKRIRLISNGFSNEESALVDSSSFCNSEEPFCTSGLSSTSYEAGHAFPPGTDIDGEGSDYSRDINGDELSYVIPSKHEKSTWSAVREYFLFQSNAKGVRIKCKLCNQQYNHLWEKYNKQKKSVHQYVTHLLSKHKPHYLRIFGDNKVKRQKTITECLQLSARPALSKEEFPWRILLWIVDTHQSFGVLKNNYFYDALQYYRQGLTLMSASTVRRRILQLFKMRRYDMIVELTQTNSKVHLTFDCWTSKDCARTFMAIIAHFINNDFKYCEWLLDFVSIEGRHTGEELAKYVENVLVEWKLTGKVMTVVGDNASNNDTLAAHLGIRLKRKMPRGRCMSHIINLGAQALMGKGVRYVYSDPAKPINTERACTSQDDTTIDTLEDGIDYDVDKDEGASDIPEPDITLIVPEPESTIDLGDTELPHNDFIDEGPLQSGYIGEPAEDQEVNDEDSASPIPTMGTVLDNRCEARSAWDVNHTIWKLRNLIKYVKNHTQMRIVYENYMEMLKVTPKRMLILDCPTRWNSTYDMLQVCIAHRKAINHAVIEQKALSQYSVTINEWEHIHELTTLLKTFNNSHLKVSSSSTISASKILITFHKIKSVVEKFQPGNRKYEAFRDASLYKLNTYEEKVRASPLCAIALLLDPRQKVESFGRIGWNSVDTSKALDDLSRYFFAYSQVYGQRSVEYEPLKVQSGEDSDDEYYSKDVSSTNEVTDYLHEKIAERQQDPLEYWKTKSTVYPILSRMARDILAVPATSCATERMFSSCRDHLGVRRNRLSEETFRALMFLEGNGLD